MWSFLLLLLLVLQDGPVAGPPDLPRPAVDVFVAGAEGYHTYRIPAIVRAEDGTLLAFAEGRRDGRGRGAGDGDHSPMYTPHADYPLVSLLESESI